MKDDVTRLDDATKLRHCLHECLDLNSELSRARFVALLAVLIDAYKDLGGDYEGFRKWIDESLENVKNTWDMMGSRR